VRQLLLSGFLSIPLIGAFVLFSLGIVVIYRASRVLNLAHGAMAMLPAYAFYSLAGWGVPTPVAVVLAVAVGAALGVAVEYVFVRRLRPQGPTAQTVGTVAVTGLLIAVVSKVYGTLPVQPPGVFPEGTFTVSGAAIRYGELGLLATGLLTAAGLFTFFKRTEFGLAMRGSAQNRTAAILMGVDPDRAASAAWALGGGLAGLAGVLLAAVTNLNPYTLSLQVLPAVGAVLRGGLESLAGAVVGSAVAGLSFGLVSVLNDAPAIGRVLRLSGAPQLVLTVLAVVVMVVRGGRFSGAEAAGAGLDTSGGRPGRRLAGPRAGVGSFTLIGVLVVWPFVMAYSVVGSSLLAVEFGLIALSLVVLIGWVGQISLAQASFVGIGAAVTAAVGRAGIGFPANAVVGVAVAAAVAIALGAVALRVRGLYLAVATLIFAWMADAFLFPSPWLGLGGGSTTIPNQAIGKPGTIPSFDLTERTTLFLAFLAIVVPVVFALANVRDTRTGRAFFAIRGSEVAAASLGVDVVRYKLLAFGLSGALAGLAGALLVVEQRTVVSDQFLFTVSLQYLAIAVVGGLVSLQGALAAGALFAGLNELFFRVDALTGYLDVVSALLLAVVLLAYPGGLAAVGERLAVLLRPVSERLEALVARLRRPPKPQAEPERGDWLDAIRPAPVVVEPEALRLEGLAEPRPPVDRRTSPVLLSAENVTVRFGGLTAVSGASLTVHENEVVGLIGPNGAGKTTLFNAILGLNEPAEGSIALYGRDATRMQPHERAKLGVARTFQVLQLFGELDVFDNLLVATHLHNRSGIFGNLAATERTLATETTSRQRVREVLALLGLESVAHAPVRGLPFGVLRMVELGRALVTGARLLMLDEAASGLNDAETDRLVAVVRGVRDLGVSTLLIEHDVRMVTGVSDYVYVLDQGRLLADGPPAAIQRDPRVVAAYLGGAVEPALVEA